MLFWKILFAVIDIVVFAAILLAGSLAFSVLTVAFLTLFI